MQPEEGVKTCQWTVTAVVIIVLIFVGIWVFGGKKAEAPMTDGNVITGDTAGTEVNRIVMTDQFPGNVVYLSSVQLAKAGWVVIHKDKNGQPGDVIGSIYLNAGTNPGKVNLSQSTVDGGVYYAVIYMDDGDMKFTAGKDLPLKDKDGSIIMRIFHASTSVGSEIKG